MNETEFFRPGRTYVSADPFLAPELRPVFDCTAVAVHPGKRELRAFGFASFVYPARKWSSVAWREAEWGAGWTDMGPTPDRAEDDQKQKAKGPEEPQESALAEVPGNDQGTDVIPRGVLVAYHGSLAAFHGKYRSEHCGCSRCSGEDDGPRYLLRDRASDKVIVRCVRRRSVSPVF